MSQLPKETVFTHTDRSNPQFRLLEEAFEELEPQERIERISRELISASQYSFDNKDASGALDLVRSLRVCFGYDRVGYRAHLRDLYPRLPDVWHVGIKILAAPELKEKILSEIIGGWDPRCSDLEECFSFLCDIFFAEPWDSKLRKIIADVFRGHLENSYLFTAEELIPWVLRNETPDEIAKIILHGMVNTKDRDRLAGVATIREVLGAYQAAH